MVKFYCADCGHELEFDQVIHEFFDQYGLATCGDSFHVPFRKA